MNSKDWLVFVSDQAKAVQKSIENATALFKLHTDGEESRLKDELDVLLALLRDAKDYIVANEGRADPHNKFLPTQTTRKFVLNSTTVYRIVDAVEDLDAIYERLPDAVQFKPETMRLYRDVYGTLRVLQRHVNYCISPNGLRKA